VRERPWRASDFAKAAALAVVYACTTVIGRHLIIPEVFVAPVRLSMGVASFALAVTPVATWPLYIAALLPAHFLLRNPANGYSIALEYFAANVVGALVTATMLRWLVGSRPRLDNLKTCLVLVGAGAVAGPLAAATLGTPTVTRRDLTVSFWSTWQVWTMAEAAGTLVVMPALLALSGLYARARDRVDLARVGEAVVLGSGILLATTPALGQSGVGHGASLSMLYLPFPLLVWAAIRFGPTGAALANLELSSITILSMLNARGPFAGPWSESGVLAVQQFLIVTAATSMTLAGLMAERWRTLGALGQSESRYRELVESANDTIVLTTADGEILELNRAFEVGTGWNREEWRGRSVFELLGEPDRARARQEFQNAIRRGQTDTVLWRIHVKDGRTRIIEVRTTAYGAEDEVVRVMILARDVTDQIAAAEERAAVEAQLQQSRKMHAIGQLAGGIAHDFNNLLQALSGYTDLAAESLPPGHEALEPLHRVAKVADRAATLTRQLLTFSRRDSVKPELLDLGATVSEFIRILRRMIGEHIQITLTTTAGAPLINADRNQIEQIVMNLCINARDAMPAGGPLTIETGATSLSAEELRSQPWGREGTWVFLRVSDRGEGISEAARPHIFEPFFTTKQVGLGTGLGLATVYAIVERHGGFINVESTPGEGSSFTVCFSPAEQQAQPAAAERAELADAQLAGHGETILLAEDEELVRELAVEVLTSAGYRVLVARDGREAETLVRTSGTLIDVALLDVVMPFRSGRDVYDAIQVCRPGLPVLFASGYSFGELSGLPAASREAALSKPYSRAKLLAGVRAALDRRIIEPPPSDAAGPLTP
jgi:PAS domain S-box-containing protein